MVVQYSIKVAAYVIVHVHVARNLSENRTNNNNKTSKSMHLLNSTAVCKL